MSTTVTYLFDPLCGWCYGAAPNVKHLSLQSGIRLELAPTGLFAGGNRVMDATFANFAWSNDLRIQKLTGQHFSEEYHTRVLGQRGNRFDSSAAALALTAVNLTVPQQELSTLSALQDARYVQGIDTSDIVAVEKLLRDSGQGAAACLLVTQDNALVTSHAARIKRAQSLMQSCGSQGVPTMLVDNGKVRTIVPSNLIFGNFEKLLTYIAAA